MVPIYCQTLFQYDLGVPIIAQSLICVHVHVCDTQWL